MKGLSGKTYWLIGASEGLGRALALRLAREGARLVLSARSADRLNSLAAEIGTARVVPLDVTDRGSIRRAVALAGPFDGIIYNAGTYSPMSATQWEPEAAMAMCEVNFLGAMRVLGETVPAMVAAGKGDITLIGSLAAYRGLPAAIGYGASKAALASLAETMRHDLAGTGVVVRLVNPGFIRTRLTQKNSFRMPMLLSPEAAADRVLRSLRSSRFRTDFPAPFSWFIKALVFLPDFVFFRGR